MSEEIVDLYDEDGRVCGRAPRSRVRARNLRHGATAILVRRSTGEIVVHRRTDTKDVYPGLYDFCAGGVLQAGEDPDAGAAREAAEELGVRGVPLRRVGVQGYGDAATTYVAFCYEAVYDGPLRAQPEEVAWLGLLTPAELLARLDDDAPDAWRFVPDSRALWRPRLAELARSSAGG